MVEAAKPNMTFMRVAVCPSTPDGKPMVEKLTAFVSTGSQAINYNAKVWHASIMAISEPGEFIMFRWDDGGPEDTIHLKIDDPVTIKLADRSL